MLRKIFCRKIPAFFVVKDYRRVIADASSDQDIRFPCLFQEFKVVPAVGTGADYEAVNLFPEGILYRLKLGPLSSLVLRIKTE